MGAELKYMYELDKLYPKSYELLLAWSLRNNSGPCVTPINELKYDYSQWSCTDGGWSVYFKNGNGRTYDTLRLFDFFKYNKIKILLREYKDKRFEDLFKKLETRLNK